MMRAKLWILIGSTSFLSACSLFESPVLETPQAVPLPDGRFLIESGVDQLLTTPQGAFKLSGEMKLSSPEHQDALNLNISGQFDQNAHALRGQGTFTIDLPTNDTSTEHTRGIANIDAIASSNQIMFRLISTQFSGPDSESLNTNIAPLSNTWFTLPGSSQYWPLQKVFEALFPTYSSWHQYTQYLQINDISLVQMADEKAYQVAISLDKEKLLAYLDSPTTTAKLSSPLRENYKRIIPLLSWDTNLFLSQNTGHIKNMFGTITLQGQLHSDTSIAITYKLELNDHTLSAPIIVPSAEQVIDSQKLIQLLSSGQ